VEVGGVTRTVELPFVTGVLADLSGTTSGPRAPLADRRFLDIDRDNFDARMAAIRPRLTFAVPDALRGQGHLQVDLTFAGMADFSPLAVASQVPALHALLEARRRHAEAGHRGAALAEIDRHLNRQLNLILHAEEFQRLEGTWRGLHCLVSHTETDERLRIKALDISKGELARTLGRFKGPSWDTSPLFRKIYHDGFGSPGGAPFGCLVGDYAFDHRPADVELLAEMAKIGAAAHVPFLAAASPSVMQLDSWRELPIPRDLSRIVSTPEYAAWHALRDSETARYLGLTLPRFLVRPPYRSDTASPERFGFEEETGNLRDTMFVWANAAYLMAVNVHRSFRTHGWCTRLRGLSAGAVDGLPVVREADGAGGVTVLGPTEVAITDRRELELARLGFIALLHWRDSAVAAFVSTPSLARPAEYDDAEATTGARLAAQLPHVFASCRIAHYVKAIVRDRWAGSPDRRQAQRWLEEWIADYVDPDPPRPDARPRSPRPLAAASIAVEPAPGDPAALTAKISIRLND
jgi:type VI secretion system protein ImpC